MHQLDRYNKYSRNRISLVKRFILLHDFLLLYKRFIARSLCAVDSHLKQSIELPYFSKYLLIAAYLASYNPARSDKKFFVKVRLGKVIAIYTVYYKLFTLYIIPLLDSPRFGTGGMDLEVKESRQRLNLGQMYSLAV